MKINIAVCDDNEAFVHQLIEMLRKCIVSGVSSYRIYPYSSGEILKQRIKRGLDFDIIFLDIDLNEYALGTSLGSELKQSNPDILLIYISAYSCYYEELAKAEPFSFLAKPIDMDELKDIIGRAIKRLYYIKKEFIFKYKTNGIVNKVDLKNVIYFESRHRIINIYTCDGNCAQYYDKLDNVERSVEEIYPYFLRPSKSYYVNYNYVERFSDAHVHINNLDIKISLKYKQRFQDKMHFLL